MDFSKFINYTFEDFLNDDAFLAFVVEQNASDVLAWEKFRAAHPYKSRIALAAFDTISAYRQQKVFSNEQAQQSLFEKISVSITAGEPKVKKLSFSPFFKVAAVFAVVLLSAVLYFTMWNKDAVKTDYGIIKTITLPDGSEVTLNGNSKISYAPNFNDGPREVWIDGEALFKVKHINIDTNHIQPDEKFIVHCGDLNIEVLGTTFNVKSRHEKTSIGLLTGKIRVDYDDFNKKRMQFVMKPGDLVKHADESNLVHQKMLNPQHLTAWINRQLVFQNASLEEMIGVLQDDLGYEVVLDDKKMSELKVEGEINVGSVKELLQILSTTLHLNIKTNNKKITITR
ncbi:FecR family protein [uncultured Pedobacter sp.]|uniref:FecR family protein n=1 Tax=uncultured Pedobacter sp. TaxID=246139 RepID=UPI0025E695F5|nr:FecR domain-containing protein [uncultured Pedobacter sp.]